MAWTLSCKHSGTHTCLYGSGKSLLPMCPQMAPCHACINFYAAGFRVQTCSFLASDDYQPCPTCLWIACLLHDLKSASVPLSNFCLHSCHSSSVDLQFLKCALLQCFKQLGHIVSYMHIISNNDYKPHLNLQGCIHAIVRMMGIYSPMATLNLYHFCTHGFLRGTSHEVIEHRMAIPSTVSRGFWCESPAVPPNLQFFSWIHLNWKHHKLFVSDQCPTWFFAKLLKPSAFCHLQPWLEFQKWQFQIVLEGKIWDCPSFGNQIVHLSTTANLLFGLIRRIAHRRNWEVLSNQGQSISFGARIINLIHSDNL